MIIWGSRGITSIIGQHNFHCPRCDQARLGYLKQVRTYFTIYFIPLIPMMVAGRYVECTSCSGSYGEEILGYDPEKERQETFMQLLRVMITAALADGMVDDKELREIQKQYQEMSGFPAPDQVVQKEIELAQNANATLNSYVGTIAGTLSPQGKGLVIKLAFHTMAASGGLQPGHQEQLMKLSETLRVPQDQFMALIQQLSEAPKV